MLERLRRARRRPRPPPPGSSPRRRLALVHPHPRPSAPAVTGSHLYEICSTTWWRLLSVGASPTALHMRGRGRYPAPNCSRIRRVTSPPSARPLVSRITAPTSGPIAFALPSRTRSAAVRLGRDRRRDDRPQLAGVRSLRGPRARRSRPGRHPPRPGSAAPPGRPVADPLSLDHARRRRHWASGSTGLRVPSPACAQRGGELAGHPVRDHARLDAVGGRRRLARSRSPSSASNASCRGGPRGSPSSSL